MKRHPLDLIALLFGFAFLMIGGAFVVVEESTVDFNPAWVVAGGFIALGVVALAVTITRHAQPTDIEET